MITDRIGRIGRRSFSVLHATSFHSDQRRCFDPYYLNLNILRNAKTTLIKRFLYFRHNFRTFMVHTARSLPSSIFYYPHPIPHQRTIVPDSILLYDVLTGDQWAVTRPPSTNRTTKPRPLKGRLTSYFDAILST